MLGRISWIWCSWCVTQRHFKICIPQSWNRCDLRLLCSRTHWLQWDVMGSDQPHDMTKCFDLFDLFQDGAFSLFFFFKKINHKQNYGRCQSAIKWLYKLCLSSSVFGLFKHTVIKLWANWRHVDQQIWSCFLNLMNSMLGPADAFTWLMFYKVSRIWTWHPGCFTQGQHVTLLPRYDLA